MKFLFGHCWEGCHLWICLEAQWYFFASRWKQVEGDLSQDRQPHQWPLLCRDVEGSHSWFRRKQISECWIQDIHLWESKEWMGYPGFLGSSTWHVFRQCALAHSNSSTVVSSVILINITIHNIHLCLEYYQKPFSNQFHCSIFFFSEQQNLVELKWVGLPKKQNTIQRAIFNWSLKEIKNSISFASPYSCNWARKSIQSNAVLKCNLVPQFFLYYKSMMIVCSEFSLALSGVFPCYDWLWWLHVFWLWSDYTW